MANGDKEKPRPLAKLFRSLKILRAAFPFLVLVAAAAFLAFTWLGPERPRQTLNMRTAITVICSGLLLFLWFLFFSRAGWRIRGTVAVLAISLLLLARETLEIRGVTGDLVPIIALKGQRQKVLPHDKLERTVAQTALPTTNGAAGAEFLQFMGENRDGIVRVVEFETNWQAHPPKNLWQKAVGAAWSGFAVKNGLAVTQEQRSGAECVVAYDLLTGSEIWMQPVEAKFSTTIAGEGPRSTPTIEEDQVYTFGATGWLRCFELGTGRLVWSKDVAQELDARVPEWGFASAPLLVDGKVVVSAGGSEGRSLAAFKKEDGSLAWAKGSGGADFSSPIAMTLAGTPQIVIFNSFGVVGHAVAGDVLWQYKWRGGHPHISMPLLVGSNQVFVSSGYGTGCELLEIKPESETEWKAERVWKSNAMKSKFGPLLLKNGHVYGLDDGIFSCVELKSGQRKWKDGRYGHGQALLAGETILLMSEKGELVCIEPNPEKLLELSTLQVFSEKTWNPLAVAGEYVLARNNNEAACLQLQRVKRQKIASVLFAKAIFD